MSCNIRPTVYNKYLRRTIVAPCRCCMGCRIDNLSQWRDRCRFEMRSFFEHDGLSCSFVGLSYRTDKMKDGSLHVDDLQRFFKRLRSLIYNRRGKYYALGLSNLTHVKYLFVGEYAPETARPHYHGIFFGLGPRIANELIHSAWSDGISFVGPVMNGGVRYVLKYIMKQSKGAEYIASFLSRGIEPPFVCRSNGIGRRYMEDHRDELVENCGYYHNGRFVKLSPYYREKLGIDSIVNIDAYNKLICDASISGMDTASYLKLLSRSREKSLLANARLSGSVPVDLLVDDSVKIVDNDFVNNLVLDTIDPIPF